MQEIWKEIPSSFGFYHASNFGNIKRTGQPFQKKPTIASVGYPVVSIWIKGKGSTKYVHDLIAETFIGIKPKEMCVNHIDGNKCNNRPDNLEYISLADNTRHAFNTGLCNVSGSRNHFAKLNENQVREIRRMIAAGAKTKDIAKAFHVGSPIVSQIKHGTRWAHLK